MSTSLSSLVDNLSEIYKEECKACKEREKIKFECDFNRLKNDQLHWCKECKKGQLKTINWLIKKFSSVY